MYNLVIVSITLIALYNIFLKAGLYPGIKWLLITFFLGYRTLTIVPGFLLHPIDIIILALFLKAQMLPRVQASTYPLWLLALIPIALWGLFNGLNNSWYPARVWFDFKNFALIFPLFYVLDKFLKQDEDFPPIAYTQILVISTIALFGLLEYYVTPFRQILSGFYNPNIENSLDAQGFKRASFTFWGAITVGHIMITALPLLVLVRHRPFFVPTQRLFVFGALLLNAGAFYIMGNRADWLTFILLAVLFYFLIYKRKAALPKRSLTLLIVTIGGLIALQYLDQAFISRFMTGVEAITSTKSGYDAQDSSGYIRQQRLLNALATVKSTPGGVGWSMSGWVHSDFVQITANMGWIGGLLFLGGYLSLTIRAFRLRFMPFITEQEKDIISSLLMSHVAVGFMLAVNNNYVLTQSGVPLFFLWALLHVYATKLERELRKRRGGARLQAQRPLAHLQQ